MSPPLLIFKCCQLAAAHNAKILQDFNYDLVRLLDINTRVNFLMALNSDLREFWRNYLVTILFGHVLKIFWIMELLFHYTQ